MGSRPQVQHPQLKVSLTSVHSWLVCSASQECSDPNRPSIQYFLNAVAAGGHTLTIDVVTRALQLLWVRFVMPEPEGIPREEIQKELGIE